MDLALRCGLRVVEGVVGDGGFLQCRRPSARLATLAVDCRPQLVDALGELGVLGQRRLGPPQRVVDGRVVAVAVEAPDLRQREIGQLTGEEDRDLAGPKRGGGATAADQLGPGDAEGARHPLLDLLDGGPLRSPGDLRDQLGDQLDADRPRVQRGVGEDAGERPAQAAQVRVAAPGQLR